MIIKGIFELPYAQEIAFKGGTAAYFLHGLDRFSTDIDLDYRGTKQAMVYDDIKKICTRYGTVKGTRHLIISYKSGYDNIKIDISRKVRNSNMYETVNFYGTDIIVQTKETIVANKFVAFTERGLNRDIYDMWYFLKEGFLVNEAVVLERTGQHMKDFWATVQKKLLKLGKDYNILDGLGEVIDEKQKHFVKNKLIKELLGFIAFRKNFG